MKSPHILLGVCGSIAAYKSAYLVRLLKSRGYRVRVLMTESSKTFISPLTLGTLSEEAVLSTMYEAETGVWHNHVALSEWADAMVIAPMSAHTLSKMAYGQCDNVLLATYLSLRKPVLLAPAMDRDMYLHATTQSHIAHMRALGHRVVEGKEGALASGLWGKGRMAEPEDIANELERGLKRANRFANKSVMLTSGPTYEYLDPVRFISSPSTGRMGMALAEAFAQQGAQIDLLSADEPTSYAFQTTQTRIRHHTCCSAEDMYKVAKTLHPKCEVAVFAASVSDYRPAQKAEHKYKSKPTHYSLKLVKNPDIAYELGKHKSDKQIHMGFAIETQHEEAHAYEKLKHKNLDLLVLNKLKDKGAGFGLHTNRVTVLFKDGKKKPFSLKDKAAVAEDLLEELYAL